jgi:23S rRNA (guanosine2251-2'-O)-methyltransferase
MSIYDQVILSGASLVETVLRHGRKNARELTVVRGGSASGLARIVRLAESAGVPVRWVERSEMETFAGKESGDLALALAERTPMELDEAVPAGATGPVLLVVIDGVEDPHNLGTILRTALAAGASAVILEKHARDLPRDVLARSSAGASECLALVLADDLALALEALDSKSVTTIAAACAEGEDLFSAKLPERVALVIGGERRGLSRRVLDACRRKVTIPTSGAVQSLPAAAAAAIAIFEIVRRREDKKSLSH